jgi:hypothetical protein
VSAGLRKFIPVPPKISLPTTTPKEIPMATCQRGVVAGRIRGKSIQVTKNPSLTSCLRTMANNTSQRPPATMVTITMGR